MAGILEAVGSELLPSRLAPTAVPPTSTTATTLADLAELFKSRITLAGFTVRIVRNPRSPGFRKYKSMQGRWTE